MVALRFSYQDSISPLQDFNFNSSFIERRCVNYSGLHSVEWGIRNYSYRIELLVGTYVVFHEEPQMRDWRQQKKKGLSARDFNQTLPEYEAGTLYCAITYVIRIQITLHWGRKWRTNWDEFTHCNQRAFFLVRHAFPVHSQFNDAVPTSNII